MSDLDRVSVAVKQIRQVPEGYTLDDVVLELDGDQQAALEALITTGKYKLAAEAAGVHRNTVGRWMKTDPFFKAAHNAWLQETRDMARGKLAMLAERAFNNVEKALDEGDRKLSYQFLKDAGYLEKQSDVATDPGIVQTQMENEVRRQASREQRAPSVSIDAILRHARLTTRRRRRDRTLAASTGPRLP
jgi:hypothetical protein